MWVQEWGWFEAVPDLNVPVCLVWSESPDLLESQVLS
jgi:hypothetical protein